MLPQRAPCTWHAQRSAIVCNGCFLNLSSVFLVNATMTDWCLASRPKIVVRADKESVVRAFLVRNEVKLVRREVFGQAMWSHRTRNLVRADQRWSGPGHRCPKVTGSQARGAWSLPKRRPCMSPARSCLSPKTTLGNNHWQSSPALDLPRRSALTGGALCDFSGDPSLSA